ncbi:MAG: hypothetical protein ACK4VI_07355 [Alphaproteobacteria bacterium]
MKHALNALLVIATLSLILSGGAAYAVESQEDGSVLQLIETEIENISESISGVFAAEDSDAAALAQSDYHQASAPGLPQLDPTWFASQAFWLLLTFAVLYFMFARNILPAISSTLENRNEHVQGELDMAHKLKSDAEEVYASYQKSLEHARAKASTLFRDVEEDIKAKSEKQHNDLRVRLAKEMELSEARLDKTRNEAMKEMDAIAAEISSAAVKKITGIQMDANSAKAFIQDLNSKAKKAA